MSTACNSNSIRLPYRSNLPTPYHRRDSSIMLRSRLNFRLRFPFSRDPVLCGSPAVTTVSASSIIDGNSTSFSWDDVFRISQTPNASSDLSGFFDKINLCNRGSEKLSGFIPFVIEEQIVGYVHTGFVDLLRRFKDVFVIYSKCDSLGFQSDHITLHSMLKTPECRTTALEDIVRCLGEEVIPGIRNEHYPVTSSFGTPAYFSLERAAAPYFGIKAYGVHMTGYIERDGEKYLWVAKRSEAKPTYPGMLDHLVAGGLPHGISCGDNIVKECEEEAGIPSSISRKAVPVGAVSYVDIDGYRYKRDVLFCYDLKLPEDFIPENQDGEVESFKLLSLTLVANIIRKTRFFKPNCNLVIIDFLFRHGNASLILGRTKKESANTVIGWYIKPDDFGYLKLLTSLRNGDCS